jgi:alpha-tubulin suppressor-like RCC1 family protein
MKQITLVISILSLSIILSSCSGGGGGGGGATSSTPVVPTIPTIELCADVSSSNLNLPLPCVCNNGYTLSTDTKSCSLTPTPPGVTFTYSPSYSIYLPLQSSTTACAGTVVTTRTMTCTRSDSVVVSNSNCSADPTPISTVQSKSGSVSVSPTNPSLSNGLEYKTCAAGSTTGTNSITCNSGYHVEGTTLANSNCYADVISCTSMPTGASTATQTWNGSSYGSCLVSTCNTSQNYIKVGNACVKCLSGETAQSNNTCLSSEVNDKLSFFQGSGIHIVSNTQTRSWGSNAYYQLGLGDTTSKPASMNMTFPTGRYPVKIYKYPSNSGYLAVMDNGSLMAWGSNSNGQLGLGATINITTPQVVNLGSGRTVKRLVVGYSSSCAILDNYSLSCWGYNNSGDLGLGNSSNALTPQAVSLGSGRTAIDVLLNSSNGAGRDIMCVILDDNSVKCSGYNQNGELGDGTTLNKNVLTSITLGSGVLAKKLYSITGANTFISTCAQDTNDNLKCWGRNDFGKLGVGDNVAKTSPTTVNLGSGKTLKSLTPSSSGHTICAILNDDSLKCWGSNSSGVLGDNSSTDRNAPVSINVGSGRTVKSYYNWNNSSYAILDNNTLVSWGSNLQGQLGVATTPIAPTAINLSGNLVKSVITSDYFACIITTTNTVMCAGINISGSVGTGITGGVYSSFQNVSLGSGRTVVELKSSAYSTCALLDNNQVKCWGSGTGGQLGDNSSQSSASPVTVL